MIHYFHRVKEEAKAINLFLNQYTLVNQFERFKYWQSHHFFTISISNGNESFGKLSYTANHPERQNMARMALVAFRKPVQPAILSGLQDYKIRRSVRLYFSMGDWVTLFHMGFQKQHKNLSNSIEVQRNTRKRDNNYESSLQLRTLKSVQPSFESDDLDELNA